MRNNGSGMPRKNTNKLRIASENVARILMLVRAHNAFRKLRSQSYLSDQRLPRISECVAKHMHPKHLRALHRRSPAPSAYREALHLIEPHFA